MWVMSDNLTLFVWWKEGKQLWYNCVNTVLDILSQSINKNSYPSENKKSIFRVFYSLLFFFSVKVLTVDTSDVSLVYISVEVPC